MITQLHDMGSARQSAKMTVKNHQKPIPFVVFKMMATTLAVAKTESNSGFSCQIIHYKHVPQIIGKKQPPGMPHFIPDSMIRTDIPTSRFVFWRS
jgi:hypothetical protein